MHRPLYLIAAGYLVISGAALWHPRPAAAPAITAPPPALLGTGDAAAWFAAMKPYCNAVEVEVVIASRPAPTGTDGSGYRAACFALAGKIDSARATIARLEGDARYRAAGIVFDVGHPVADAGDDLSAGPIMALVVEFWPNHYMALYHAGMAQYALGQRDRARTNLETFLELYSPEDGWRGRARTVLGELRREAR